MSDRTDPPLIRHLEDHLGVIAHGWSVDANGVEQPFNVVSFEPNPAHEMGVLSTLGLSQWPLLRDSGNRLRQELIMMYRQSDGPQTLPGLLQQVANEALAADRAYYPGTVIAPRGPLRSGANVAGFFVELPVYLPDSFQVCEEAKVVFAWLVPITANEAAFIATRGVEAFRDLFVTHDPDLLDIMRPSVV